MSTTLLREAIRRALNVHGVAGAALAFATVAPAMAQDAPASQTNQLETITVTGSRIRKADVETAQPIMVLDRAQIQKQGFNSVADVLQNLTEAGSPAISRAQALSSGEDVGGYYIDLRNLGNNRTLVLLNGKRLGASTSGAQDLSQVPMAAVERIEVLKDGASSIYGSDAIAGVVNIITRRNYEGLEASTYLGQFDEGDGDKKTYSLTIGTHGERGSIVMAAEYSKEDPVWAKNRPYSAYPFGAGRPTLGLSGTSQYGSFFFPECTSGRGCTLDAGADPFNRDAYHGLRSNELANSNQQMTLQTSTGHKSIFVSGEYRITDDIKFSSDFLYNKRETTQQASGYPYNSATTFQAMPLSKDSYYNPWGSWHGYEDPQDIDFLRRPWEVPRVTTSNLSTYRISATLDGSFELAGRTWNWDVGGYVNQNDVAKVSRGDINLVNLGKAIGPSFLDPKTGHVTCGTPDKPIPYGTNPGSCIPWNPILGYGRTGDGALTGNQALQNYLFPYLHDSGQTRTTDFSANLTGSLFSLPAGDLGIAVGYEHRKETGKFIPDAMTQSALTTNLSAGPTGGGYKVDDYYVELDVPVLKDVPFAKELTVNGAVRFSDYDSFGNTTNAKFGLVWRPIDDLLVRANYAEGFRAPTIADLYSGLNASFDYYTDPCDSTYGSATVDPAVMARCRQGTGGQPGVPVDFRQPAQGGVKCDGPDCQTPYQFFRSSNARLQPEKATTKTVGIVYSPSWISGLDLSADWFKVRIKDSISLDDATTALDDCYLRNIAARCSSSIFQRDPITGNVTVAVFQPFNQGWVETEGFDFGVNYRLPEFSFGRFAVRWDSTYVASLDSKQNNDAGTPVSGNTGLNSNFRLRSNLSLDWTLGDFGATWTTRYYSSIKNQCVLVPARCNMPDHTSPDTGSVPGSFPLNRLGANAFHDLQVRWNAPWNGVVAVGANNIFNHTASVTDVTINSTFRYYGGFDIGRFYYLRYTQKF